MVEGRMTIFFRRLSIMVMALIAPELMVTWAMMQFLSARDAAKTFNVFFNAQLARNNHPDSGVPLLSGSHASQGRLLDWSFGVVTNFIQRMSRRVDSDAWFFRVDGWIHALLRQ
jgi:hypothetical protein